MQSIAQHQAVIGIFPKGTPVTKIERLFEIPKNVGHDELFLPFEEGYHLEPIDKDHLVEENGLVGLIYKKGESVSLQHYGYYSGNPQDYCNIHISSGAFLQADSDFEKWGLENNHSSKLTVLDIDPFELMGGEKDPRRGKDTTIIQPGETSAIEDLLLRQSFMGEGNGISTTYGDIAKGNQKTKTKIGYDPLNAMARIQNSDGMYIFDLQIPMEKIIVPDRQITTCGGVSRVDCLVFPKEISLYNPEIMKQGFFTLQNPAENEVVFLCTIPKEYITRFRYFPHAN